MIRCKCGSYAVNPNLNGRDGSCHDLFQRMGWHCQSLPEQGALYLSTPTLLPNGSPVDFYITEDDNHIHITDDGLTLFNLRGLGYAMNDKRSQRSIATLAESVGWTLDETGCICGIEMAGRFFDVGHKIQILAARIFDWEREHFSASDSDLSLAVEVERLMRSKAPDLEIVEQPIVRLSTGDEIAFMFKWGTRYIDAIAPAAQATSARMRKAIQILRDTEAQLDALYIVDDRERPEQAAREVGLLGQVAHAIRLTDFEQHYHPVAIIANESAQHP